MIMRSVVLCSALVSGLGVTLARGQQVQLLSPNITFTVEEVFFRQPVTYLAADGTPRAAQIAVKLLLRGEGFYEGATGPRYYLGRLRADAHYTSPDGRAVAVYFYDPPRLPLREQVRIETRVDEFIILRQPFDLTRVRWLSEEVRRRHDLPNLRARLLGGQPR